MGLDMFVYKVPMTDVVDDLKFTSGNEQELKYYRKHHDLHGWFEDLYRDKGGNKEFNCVPVRLLVEDLDKLKKDIENHNLPKTSGFFFGDFPPDEESDKADLAMIKAAKAAIKEGYAIYYTSWW